MNFIRRFFTSQEEGRQPQLYNVNGRLIQSLTLISEGGYGYIWRALDVETKKICILKEIICQDDEAIKMAKNEIFLHHLKKKSLKKHPNIVECIDGAIVNEDSQPVAVMILEFCEGGTLYDLLLKHNDSRLKENQIITILKDIVNGIKHFHMFNPPIAHRDIKVENILLHNNKFKICDFGSATTNVIDLGKISKLEMSQQEEIFERYSTLMYRPPEMSDIYQRYEVNEKVDIWMLGCVLYTMCFYIHPFQDASKLAIIQASFKIPQQSRVEFIIIQLKIVL